MTTHVMSTNDFNEPSTNTRCEIKTGVHRLLECMCVIKLYL